jgi:NAD(P)-dependent dehydrogenase (short-subunit alcohol dehydrogenase family)
MLLDGRNAVIYSGGGAIGGAVARAFAREGARVHLAGRTRAPLERVAEQVRAAGGVAETAVVDALVAVGPAGTGRCPRRAWHARRPRPGR